MRILGGESQSAGQQTLQPLRSFGEYLICVPIGFHHDSDNVLDVLVGYFGLEKIAHAVYEDFPGATPREWFDQFFGNETQIESLLVWMSRHAAKPFSERFSVAMLTTRTDF